MMTGASAHNYSPETLAKLRDPWVRLNTLYHIIDKNGQKIRFKVNAVQKELYNNMHYRNVILKGRQMGLTTMIQLFMLDRCLFHPNISGGVVAHTLADATEFFERKLRYAYYALPAEIKQDPNFKLVSDSRRKLKFANNSQIYVGTNLRGGTYNILHLSEFGILCAQDPKKAQEIADGALNTVAVGNYIFIESTAAGQKGDFYDRAVKSETITQRSMSTGKKLSPLQYKFFFFPWWKHPEYRIEYPMEIPENKEQYFNTLYENEGIELSLEQKYWYLQMEESVGLNMRREYPAYSVEAFEQAETGSIFGTQLDKLQMKGEQICELPFYEGKEVNTFWDVGMDDPTAIWFHQRVGAWDHFIDFYENNEETIEHYVKYLKSKGHTYGTMYLPHDGASRSIIGVSGSVEDVLRSEGWNVRVVRRAQKKVAIDSARRGLSHSRFDINQCHHGLKALRAYKWQVSRGGEMKTKPVHNWASHAADAYQVFASVLSEDRDYSFLPKLDAAFNPAGTGRGSINKYGRGRAADGIRGQSPHVV